MLALLEIDNLFAYYGKARVLHGVSFGVPDGGITAVLGANGAGKTSLLRAISGLIAATGGISFKGQDLMRRAAHHRAALGIAHVPEGRGTFMGLTTEENLRLGAYARKEVPAGDMERMYALFPRLKERRHQQSGTLSGGEQQMLAIARALMLRPQLLILDEPSFGVAPLVIQEIYRIIRAINAEDGVSILIVEQNASLVLDIADQAILLETGRIVLSGPAAQVREDPMIRRSYVGAPKQPV